MTSPAAPRPLDESRPDRIGSYTILELLGEGGMGMVYLAEQRQPIQRRVAVKIIKLGLDTREVLARFELERQALSLMNHPNIAKVFDAGATEDGRPYFVMEHVPGTKITQYCDDHHLALMDRLELFCQVCAGLQHAHQKGIIHRDMKPSNVLVSEEDGRPVPKIIDFGLAMATDQERQGRTLFTRQGQWIGTPEYMSPEQCGTSRDVDTRSDIYSLGVMLYELLTGLLPFDNWQLREAGLAQIQRTIQEVEPLRPSTRVSTIIDGALDNAARRATDPQSLRRRLRGDLDWIVMKALEKDRARRYDTASDLAADVRRHLGHEPVQASPPSFVYRTRKLLRRHAWQVSAAVAVLISLVAGLLLSISQYRRAEHNLVMAKGEAQRAEEQSKHAERQRQAAEKSASEAIAARESMERQHAIALGEFRRSDDAMRRFTLLATVRKLQEAKRAAGELWPPWPDKVAAMRDWLNEANILNLRRPEIRSELAAIEARLPTYPAWQKDRMARLELRYGVARQQMSSSWLYDALGAFGDLRKKQELANLRQLEDQLLDEYLAATLRQLEQDLAAFLGPHGERQSVRERFNWARQVKRLSIDEASAAWAQAIAAIRKSDGVRSSSLYQGLVLEPQVGLVPIGLDPDSLLWEFAELRTGLGPDGRSGRMRLTVPQRDPRSGKLRQSEASGLVFVLIPGGTVTLGAQRSDVHGPGYDPLATANESPLREVRIEPFFLAKYEMTQGQWLRLARDNPQLTALVTSGPKQGSEALLRPIANVSWQECDTLLRQYGMELPAEAQWEYAARAGTTTAWWTGSEASSLMGAANLADATWRARSEEASTHEAWLTDGHAEAALVGSFRPNAFGLHDVIGNVSEWCRDRMGGAGSAAALSQSTAPARTCVVRGGSFAGPASAARSASRVAHDRDNRSEAIGVRPMRPLLGRR